MADACKRIAQGKYMGTGVQVCPVGKVEEFLSRVESSKVILKKFPEGLHDMLHDYERDEVREEIVAFIVGKLD